VRKWKRAREYGEAVWEFEIGEPPKSFNPEADLLAPSGENVSLHCLFRNIQLIEIIYSQFSYVKTLLSDSNGALGTLNGRKMFTV
jgi:hypothetical protein